ncbi:hypothetical protein KSB_32960 [Ktedonobacter robiniae]|uniref:Uncharacterized protein n=1 Tax=Ktedonobacter robiniae TaxID=2778365 RepID=A0ABQ3UQ10_9CHLR|nr:hypothetical protein KSB_32960 [Ktedonobacter robiniae]
MRHIGALAGHSGVRVATIRGKKEAAKYIEPELLPTVTAFIKDVLHEINNRVCYNKAHKRQSLYIR